MKIYLQNEEGSVTILVPEEGEDDVQELRPSYPPIGMPMESLPLGELYDDLEKLNKEENEIL